MLRRPWEWKSGKRVLNTMGVFKEESDIRKIHIRRIETVVLYLISSGKKVPYLH